MCVRACYIEIERNEKSKDIIALIFQERERERERERESERAFLS